MRPPFWPWRVKQHRPRTTVPGRRRCPQPLHCEYLEDRVLLSTFDVSGGQARFLVGTGEAEQLTIARVGTFLAVTDEAEVISLTAAAKQAGCHGAGTNTIWCPADGISSLDVTLGSQAGAITVRSLGLTAPVTLHSPGPFADLVVDDSADTAPQRATLTDSVLTGLGSSAVHFDSGGLHNLTIRGGSGGNTFTVAGTGHFATELDSGTGQDVVTVQGTGGPLTIDGQGGRDTVRLGAPTTGGRILAGVQGPVTVQNTGGLTDLIVDDSADTQPTQAILGNNGIAGLLSSDVPTPQSQVTPRFLSAPLTFLDAEVASLTIRGGSGGNTFTVAGTGGFATELDSGTGQDDIHVLGTGGPLTIDGQDGRDMVHVGQGPEQLGPLQIPGSPLDNIQGSVTVRNPLSRTDLIVDDSTATGGVHFTLSADRVESSVSAAIAYVPGQLESLTVTGGGTGNSFTVADTDRDAATTINAGSGDRVDVRSATGSLVLVDPDGSAQVTGPGAGQVQHVRVRGPVALGATTVGTLEAATDVDRYILQVSQAGTLGVQVTAQAGSTLDSRVALSSLDSFVDYNGLGIGGGGLLLGSDDQAPGNPDPSLSLYLQPGTYFLAVSSAGNTGSYRLTTTLQPGSDPFAGPDPDPALNREVGKDPVALIAADFIGNGILDLVTANHDSGDVSVLLGVGDASFEPETRYSVRGHPDALAAHDFNNDGRLDLGVLDRTAGIVTILPGLGDGTFSVQEAVRVSARDPLVAGLFPPGPQLTATGDFNRDGQPDRASLISADGTLAGSPPFRSTVVIDVGLPSPLTGFIDTPLGPISLPALLTTEFYLRANSVTSSEARATPLFADLTGDGVTDVVTITRTGDILVRAGQPGQPGDFGPPELLNGGDAPRARSVAVVATGARAELAAVDLFNSRVSLYRREADGTWQQQAGLVTGLEPVQVVAGDLDGDGRPDLVVANNLFGFASLSIYRGEADGTFTHVRDIAVGTAISNIALADVNHDGHLDLLVTNPDAGDVGVLLNQGLPAGQIGFQPEVLWRAGAGPYGAEESEATPIANEVFGAYGLPATFPALFFTISNEETQAVAVGDFTGDGVADLVVTNRGSDTFALLPGIPGAGRQPTGSFVDPQVFAAGNHPTAVQAADFNGDGKLDLAILNQGDDTVWIYQGDGHGHFTHTFTVDAGGAPTGLAVADVNGDGKLDLVVGNAYGDFLVLLDNGDGTFREPHGQNVSLAVAGTAALAFSNQAQDHLSVKDLNGVQLFAQGRANGILAPGPVQTVDVGGGQQALVVANSGANDVLVYLGSGGRFDPAAVQTFFAGTDPVGITIADVNQDGVPDVVVANEGSNDVSVFFGQGAGSEWTLIRGPRLQVGDGPVSTAMTTINGVPYLAVANSQSNDVWMLPSRGNGFFSDRPQDLIKVPVGLDPQQILPGHFDSQPGPELVTVDEGSNTLTVISDLTAPRPLAVDISSGGQDPVAAVASDFNRDGSTDLIVANNADGHVSLLLGGETGLILDQILAGTDAAHPTALVLSPTADGSPVVYVASEGTETATLLAFNLPAPFELSEEGHPTEAGSSTAGPTAVPPEETVALAPAGTVPLPVFEAEPDSGEQRPEVVDLQPLTSTGLEVVATVVAGPAADDGARLEGGPVGPDLAVPGDTAADGSSGLAVSVVSLFAGPRNGGAEDRVEGNEGAVLPGEADRSVDQFVVGVGEPWRGDDRAAPGEGMLASWLAIGQEAVEGVLGPWWVEQGQEAGLWVHNLLSDLSGALRQGGRSAAQALGDLLDWESSQQSSPARDGGPLPGAVDAEEGLPPAGAERPGTPVPAAPTDGGPLEDGKSPDTAPPARGTETGQRPDAALLDVLFASDPREGVRDGDLPGDREQDRTGIFPAVVAALLVAGSGQAWRAEHRGDRTKRKPL